VSGGLTIKLTGYPKLKSMYIRMYMMQIITALVKKPPAAGRLLDGLEHNGTINWEN